MVTFAITIIATAFVSAVAVTFALSSLLSSLSLSP